MPWGQQAFVAMLAIAQGAGMMPAPQQMMQHLAMAQGGRECGHLSPATSPAG